MEQAVVSIQGDSPREGGLAPHARRGRPLAFALAAALLLAVGVYALYVRGGGPVPERLAFLSPAESALLAESSPAEAALRALRLAGIERAVVGEQGSDIVARIQVPAITSAADIEMAWQTAATVLSQSHPGARTYVVQLFGLDAVPLIEVSLPGRETRETVGANDAAALRSAATVRYLSPAPISAPPAGRAPAAVSATAIPSLVDYVVRGLIGRPQSIHATVAPEQARAARALRDAVPAGAVAVPPDALVADVDVAGAYLDAKNRAAGVLGETGPVGEYAATARAAVAADRAAVPGRPAPGPDEDAGMSYSRRLGILLAPQLADVAGARALSEAATAIAPGAEGATVIRLRTWLAVVEAMSAEKPFGSVLGPAAASVRATASARVVQRGPLAEAVRAAAGSSETPAYSVAVARFTRVRSADVSTLASASAAAAPTSTVSSIPAVSSSLPQEVLARVVAGAPSDGALPTIVYSDGGLKRVAVVRWLAYRRADGAYFWLAGPSGRVALTDASVRGWAWSVPQAALVDAAHVGRTLALFDLR